MIAPGEIYEDCAFHPVLCTGVDGDEVEGISLIDGSHPRSCSLQHCGVVRLSIEDAVRIRADLPGYVEERMAQIDRLVKRQQGRPG